MTTNNVIDRPMLYSILKLSIAVYILTDVKQFTFAIVLYESNRNHRLCVPKSNCLTFSTLIRYYKKRSKVIMTLISNHI